MALGAGDREMFPLERILCLTVIEIDGIDRMPSFGAVTGTAIVPELAGMSIGMAGSTVAECDTLVAHVIEICFGWTVGH